MMNNGALRDICTDDYGFQIEDLTVAVLIKAYLQQLNKDAAHEQLERIVSPGVRGVRGGTVKKRGLAKHQWITINAAELARLIDNARAAAAISADAWRAMEGEHLLQKTIDYIKDDVLPVLSVERYAAGMPAKMAEFITDCWLAME